MISAGDEKNGFFKARSAYPNLNGTNGFVVVVVFKAGSLLIRQ
jgi:hypothetical protein